MQAKRVDILQAAWTNDAFRRVVLTGDHEQVVVMTIPPGGEIGDEVHDDTDQILAFVDGRGEARLDGEVSQVGAERRRVRPCRHAAQLRQHRRHAASADQDLRAAGARTRNGPSHEGRRGRRRALILVLISHVGLALARGPRGLHRSIRDADPAPSRRPDGTCIRKPPRARACVRVVADRLAPLRPARLPVGQQLPVHQDRGRCRTAAVHARRAAAASSVSLSWRSSWPPRASSCRAACACTATSLVMARLQRRHPVLPHHLGRAERRLHAGLGPERGRTAVRDRDRRGLPARRADQHQPTGRPRHRVHRCRDPRRLRPGRRWPAET